MTKKDPLGKGLSAILKDVEEKGTTRLIPVVDISPGEMQPRLDMKEETLLELASSIREKGVLQPIILRRKGGGYEIIAGERRYRAAVMAGLNEVPAIIKDVDDKEALELAMIENLQREDLNPIEVARMYERFADEFGYTHEEIGKRLGINRSSVTNFIRLLKLPEWIQGLIKEGKLTYGHGRVLINLKNEDEQRRFVKRVVQDGISVRELERAVKKKEEKKTDFPNLERIMGDALGTKVTIKYTKNRGTIVINFYSKEDLERIAALISKDL
ncbi:MAG: ParB/RepB/Spo0J family partition protein [Syntrophorhabdaceae bacterium]|nr:ParB/RepB/Spo0J family partition protein [Syntrophorhabdaceae bacterium]